MSRTQHLSLIHISLMPNVPMVGVFDTAFHQTMPEKAYLYGLPYEYYVKYKIRKMCIRDRGRGETKPDRYRRPC